MKPIASNKHFERMLKQFKTISFEQIQNNNYLSNVDKSILFKFYEKLESSYDIVSNILLNNFKRNKYKTHSSIDDVMYSEYINRIWLSYTVENGRTRYKKKDFKNKTLVFKVHYKFGNYRKKLVARWRVPIIWL